MKYKKPPVLRAVVICFTVLTSECSHFYYVSPVQDVPLFTQKNEYRVSAFIGSSTESISGNMQAAWSVTDNIAVMANVLFAKGLNDANDSWGRGFNADAGAGYFKPSDRHRIFEIYGGTGFSRQHHVYRETIFNEFSPSHIAGNSSLSSFKLFLQPSVGWKFKGFETALSARFNSLSFFNINNDITWSLNEHEYNKLNSLEGKRTYFFFEPAITIRFGMENVKIQVQGTAGSYMNDEKSPFDQVHLNAGLFCSF
jgi:hypothetical protein